MAALIGGGTISTGSLAGLLTVYGVTIFSGIVLLRHYQRLATHEGESLGLGLVLRGSRERVAPTLISSIAVALAFLPLLIFGDIPGHEIGHPMSIVVLGGLVTSSVVNLFIVPALFLQFGSIPERHRASEHTHLEHGQAVSQPTS